MLFTTVFFSNQGTLMLLLALMMVFNGISAESAELRYAAEDNAIVIRNGTYYNNRPLYGSHLTSFTLAGDRPLLLLADGHTVNGTFMIAMIRGKQGFWLHEASRVTARYQAGSMEWDVEDSQFSNFRIRLQAVPMAASPGFAARIAVERAEPGDRIIWAWGGTRRVPNIHPYYNASWAMDALSHPEILNQGFSPEHCQNNNVSVEGDLFIIRPSADEAKKNPPLQNSVGRCSVTDHLRISDASGWRDFADLAAAEPNELPFVTGMIPLDQYKEAFWTVRSVLDEKIGDVSDTLSLRQVFEEGQKHIADVSGQIVVDTPDERLNAAAAASSVAMNALWIPPVFAHGAMNWKWQLLGWRSIFGGICYGWHDRVKQQAEACIGKQIKESSNQFPSADPAKGYSSQAKDSRFFGKGYIKDNVYHPDHYDMQSQFFDQILHGWRYTADPELEKLLRPALDLHCQWMQDCFDPDNNGVYESYINAWPTDSVWYNGADTAEETSYAFRAHQAARDLALRAGDDDAARRHSERLTKIQQGFMEQLWISHKGHPGAYREQTGDRRLNENAWLYSIFLPIDAGLLTPLQMAEALHYTEWGLQNDLAADGGRHVWTSNYVPSIWSVRELWPGDNYHLALAYYIAGLPHDGWEIFKGTFLENAYNSPSPGNLGHKVGGLDFSDPLSMFCRTLVEGLFGYRPDYPNNRVMIAPQLPPDWEHGSIRTPDFALTLQRQKGRESLVIELTRPAVIDLRLPVSAMKITRLTVNGNAAKWQMLPGNHCSTVRIQLAETTRADVELRFKTAQIPTRAQSIETVVGQEVEWTVPGKKIVRVEDPQTVLHNPKIRKNSLTGTVRAAAGHHLLRALATSGDMEYWQLFKIKVKDPDTTEKQKAISTCDVIPGAKWDCIDLSQVFNADVRTIYEQKYLSPRPQTVSVSIGSDGYSPWTFYPWNVQRPVIDLDHVNNMLDTDGRLMTAEGIPFAWGGLESNIAFTSRWDNWPNQITVPVNRKGQAVWLLICGSSNPMQCGIANAAVRIKYEDGVLEKLELIHPTNYWMLCPYTVPHGDYNYERDGFCLPDPKPMMVQLGKNCRANLLSLPLRPDVSLESITLETLSPEVVVGLMGISMMDSHVLKEDMKPKKRFMEEN